MVEPDRLLARADHLLARLEALLQPTEPEAPEWNRAVAFRWHAAPRGGRLVPVKRRSTVLLEDLRSIDRQMAELDRNTRQFLVGLPANNALLWGPRGTGKSSLIKALLNSHADEGLRLIEVDRDDLSGMQDLMDLVAGRPERFIVFCDDLSFDIGDSGYRTLKASLDGSIAELPENVLIYATSNRRHLVPEQMRDNEDTRIAEGEIHYGDAVEEKISLSERFGICLAFHAFRQEEYLSIVRHWLNRFGIDPDVEPDVVHTAALQWALAHGSRSGRSARQFARDWAGRRRLEERG